MARRDNGILGCIRKCGQQVEGADPAPLVSPREATSGGVLWPIQSQRFKQEKELLERGPAEATVMDLVWCIIYEEKL